MLTQPYRASPPTSRTMVGSAVATTVASIADRKTASTSPTSVQRRPTSRAVLGITGR